MFAVHHPTDYDDYNTDWLLSASTPRRSLTDGPIMEVFRTMCDLVEASELIEFERSEGLWRIRHTRAMLDAIVRGEERQRLEPHDILAWHADLFPMGGVWRISGVYLRGMSFAPPPAETIPLEMRAFCDDVAWWLTFSPETPSYRMAFLHDRFEHLHPFTDGNGRVGRLILNFTAAYLRAPLVKITPDHRDQYIAALEARDILALARLFNLCSIQF
jgi:fido (protein-threonine AMPylation protein)